LRGSIVAGIAVAAAALTAGYVIVGDHSDYSISSFSGTYDAAAANETCTGVADNAYIGREPTAGTHPVMIYLRGSLGNHSSVVATFIIETFAKRGFVAASADYVDTDNGLQDNTGYSAQADCVYDTDSATSLAGILCARARADCSKGIVAMGHSQGGAITIRAHEHEPRVVAVLNMGWGSAGAFETEAPLTVPPAGTRTLPNPALRLNMGNDELDIRTELNERTGQNCTTGDDCLQADGSGYYAQPDADASDGSADHCWFMVQGGFCTETAIQAGWDTNPPTKPWHIRSMIEWADGKTSE
jgi:hypothetical protein